MSHVIIIMKQQLERLGAVTHKAAFESSRVDTLHLHNLVSGNAGKAHELLDTLNGLIGSIDIEAIEAAVAELEAVNGVV